MIRLQQRIASLTTGDGCLWFLTWERSVSLPSAAWPFLSWRLLAQQRQRALPLLSRCSMVQTLESLAATGGPRTTTQCATADANTDVAGSPLAWNLFQFITAERCLIFSSSERCSFKAWKDQLVCWLHADLQGTSPMYYLNYRCIELRHLNQSGSKGRCQRCLRLSTL